MARHKVLEYDKERMEHLVRVLSGENVNPSKFYVDLLMASNFGKMTPEDLVGEVVSIDSMRPSSYIVDEASLVEDN